MLPEFVRTLGWRMFIFCGLWSVFLNLMLVATCWGSVESLERTALIDVHYDINGLYFGHVFAEENNRLLEAIMVSVRKVYDRYELYQWPESHFAPDNQTEHRRQLLTRLVQQATRHTIAKITGNDDIDDSYRDRSMFHLLQAFSGSPAMEESRDVIHWYRNQPVLLQGVPAEDRRDSMESLIQEAVQNSFREFPSNPFSRKQLARQLGFILLEMQELFLRGRGLRSLSYEIEQQKQNPKIAGDPAFILYLSFLTELFNSHEALWHRKSLGSKWRQYQEDLYALFMKAAHHENYGIERYQRVRRILDGEKLLHEKPARKYYSYWNDIKYYLYCIEVGPREKFTLWLVVDWLMIVIVEDFAYRIRLHQGQF
ncbi:hypothetical protein [Endozoicomonas sp. ALD068]|uniref:hypothetical protein n=2 Tax=Endozoicomonas TaxID=305899 RepID=UPI003BB660F4